MNWRSGINNLKSDLFFLSFIVSLTSLLSVAISATPQPAKSESTQRTEKTTHPAAESSKNKFEAHAKPPQAQNSGKPTKEELVERIRAALKFGNSQQVRDALHTLSKLSEAEQHSLLPELKATCNSQDGLVLRKMAEFIGSVKFTELDFALGDFLLNKTYDPVFFTAVAAIAKKKPAAALPIIIKEIREQDFAKPGNRVQDLMHLLALYKDKSLQAFLVEKLHTADTYTDYRSAILKYMGESAPWSAEEQTQILKLFSDEAESLTVRGAAAYALGKAQVGEARQALKAMLAKIDAMTDMDEKKKNNRFRLQLIYALILLKDNDVKEILFSMARDDDEIIRARAVHQLGKLEVKEARELLLYKSKYDPSLRVQKEAKKALTILDGAKNESEPESVHDTP